MCYVCGTQPTKSIGTRGPRGGACGGTGGTVSGGGAGMVVVVDVAGVVDVVTLGGGNEVVLFPGGGVEVDGHVQPGLSGWIGHFHAPASSGPATSARVATPVAAREASTVRDDFFTGNVFRQVPGLPPDAA
jgi:hypothetical protein